MSKIVISNMSGDFSNLETFRIHLVRGLLRDRLEYLLAEEGGTLDESVAKELSDCLLILQEDYDEHAVSLIRTFKSIFTATGTPPGNLEPAAAPESDSEPESETEPAPQER